MNVKQVPDVRQQRMLENLLAENSELKQQLAQQSEAILELADLVVEKENAK